MIPINQVYYPLLVENLEGYDDLWFLGDNFMARCFRQFFKNAPETGKFVKERFEVFAFCNSRYASNELNILI